MKYTTITPNSKVSPPRLSPRQKAFKIHLFPNQNTVRARLGTVRARLSSKKRNLAITRVLLDKKSI